MATCTKQLESYLLKQKIAGGFCNSLSVCKASGLVSANRTSSLLWSWQGAFLKNVEESKHELFMITW